jgi:hypothetical protein
MGLQIRCYVNGNQEFIDLYGNENIELEVSFAEIQDITKKNSAFTKEFNIPGSKNNNYIFNYFFDINSVYLNWNPKKKFEADLLYDGYELYNGYIRMNSVSINKTEKVYSITFYNGVGDVAANIGDKFLRQLDLSHLTHPFTSNVYLQSQVDYNLFPLTGTTDYSYQNGKTMWGLYNIGYNYVDSLSAITSYYLGSSSTSVSIISGTKTITTSSSLPFIVGDTIRLTATPSLNFIQGRVSGITGTTIVFVPNLGLGTGTYTNWLVSRQLVDGEQIPDPTTSPIIDFQRNGVPNYISFSGTPVRNYYFKPSLQVKELYTQIFEQADYLIESAFFETNYFERFYLPLKFLDETIYTKGADVLCFNYNQKPENVTYSDLVLSGDAVVQSAVTCASSAITYNLTGFTIPTSYSSDTTNYSANVSFIYNVPQDPTCSAPFVFDVLFGTALTNASVVYSVNICNDLGPSSDYSANFTINNIPLGLMNGLFITGSNIPQIFNFAFQLISPPVIVGNFDYSKEFPDNDFKQIDFIISINKLFNLVVIPHPTKTNTLIVEPIVDYIGKGEILDWTDKIDWDSTLSLSPTSSILNGTIDFNFRLDKDYGNQQFNIASNRTFGSYKKLLNQDYKDSTINITPLFGSPTDIGLNNNTSPALTSSNMSAIKDENKNGQPFQKYNPFRILPRLVFRGPVLPNDNWGLPNVSGDTTQQWWAESTPISYWQETSRFTTYPFAYSGFSHYINWNAEDTNDTRQSFFPTMEDMYDVYYFDYIDDIISAENKILSAKIYLNPWDVANLRFDEKIIIRNAYYRINKIGGLNLTDPGLCDIELVKLTKDYTSHTVKYFDLINCNTGGTDYHTTSDLNYNLYAYVGNYVNIFTGSTTAYTSIGCFEVVEGQPNTTYDYQHIFIGSGYTNSSVGVFSDCGCSAKTAFDIVQQV